MSPGNSDGLDDRLRRIESVTDSALAHLGVEELLVELLGRVRELLHADTAAVLLLDPTARQLVATAASGLEEEVWQNTRLPLGEGFAGRVAAQRRPVTVEHVDHRNVANPVLRAKGLRSLLGVPMVAGGALTGVLHVGTLVPRRFSDDDTRLLQLAADRVALATEARSSGVDRAAARALQRSLLPTRLPDIPGFELAARHVTGEAGGVGGDWYDVFTLPSGALGIAIGDVIGRGMRAAVVMGRLRSALRAYALESDDPGAILGSLSRKVQHFEPETMATVTYAILEPSFGRLRLAVAGHPPPVLAAPGTRASLLRVPTNPPVGAPSPRPRRTCSVALPPGAVACFYTDGLVERRGKVLDDGLRRLCGAVVAAPAESVCATVMAELVGAQAPRDDIALLTLRRRDALPDGGSRG